MKYSRGLILIIIIILGGYRSFAQTYWQFCGISSWGPGKVFIAPNGNIYGTMYNNAGGEGLWMSTNNGDNWSQVWLFTNGISSIVFNAASLGSGYIFLANNQAVYRSTNNGLDWTDIGLNNLSNKCLAINSDGAIYAGYTGNGTIFKSTDNGNTWTNTNLNVDVRDIACNSTGNIYAATPAGMFESDDDGNSWSAININLTNTNVYSVYINSEDIILIGTSEGGVFRSPDNGNSWIDISINVTDRVGPIVTNSAGDIFAGINTLATTAGVYKSTDNGSSWVYYNSGMEADMIINLIKNNNDILFAGTENQGIYRTINSTTPVERVETIPAEVELFQNYPNPFNPTTKIEYSVPHTGYVTLKVYDVLGNEIRTLVNEEKTTGRYNISFDGSSLASGIYFYVLRVADLIQRNKMILIK